MLSGKKIIVGVTAGIAAYKSASLIRLLIKEGAEVRVVMTPASHDFITPLTLSTLSKNPVVSHFSNNKTGEWNNHVELGLWADIMIIAPATANTIGKMANGLCDNMLLATYLSARCPVYVTPAMDSDMYNHQSVANNLDKLKSFGNIIVDAEHGELASGLIGDGRMAEPENILSAIKKKSFKHLPLKNKTFLVSAGPTIENLDPVRFIGNNSSGKMGFAIAEKAAELGASVILVSGPTDLNTSNSRIKKIDITSAEEMYEACSKAFADCDVCIMAAAVADYSPVSKSNSKIKKKDDYFTIELRKTKDILKHLGEIKENQTLIGFAMETDNVLENAQDKLVKKNLDFIVVNSLNEEGAGFKHDTNKVFIIDKSNNVTDYELKNKSEVASDILNKVIDYLCENSLSA